MKDAISFNDFNQMDLRVGKIIKVEIPEGSETLYRLTVDLGKELGKRIIFSGLKQTHTKKKLENKLGVFIVNLEAKKMMGEESQGMMLMVDEPGEKPIMIIPEEKVKPGSVIR